MFTFDVANLIKVFRSVTSDLITRSSIKKKIKILTILLSIFLILFPIFSSTEVYRFERQKGYWENETVVKFGDPFLAGYIVPLGFYSEVLMWLGVLILIFFSIMYAISQEFNLISSSTVSIISVFFISLIKLNTTLQGFIIINLNPMESLLTPLLITLFMSAGLNILHILGISLGKVEEEGARVDLFDKWRKRIFPSLSFYLSLFCLILVFFGVYFFTSYPDLNLLELSWYLLEYGSSFALIVGVADLIINARNANICSSSTLSFSLGAISFITWRLARGIGLFENFFLIIIMISSVLLCLVQGFQMRKGVFQIYSKPDLKVFELFQNPPRRFKQCVHVGLIVIFSAPLIHIFLSEFGVLHYPFNFIVRGIYDVFGELYFFKYHSYRLSVVNIFYYVVCNTLVFSWVWVSLLKLGKIKSKKIPQQGENESSQINVKFKHARTFLFLICIVTVLVYSWRYTEGLEPMGSDMDWYLQNLEDIKSQGLSAAFKNDRPLFFILLNFVQRLTGLSSAAILVISPVLFSVIYAVSIYQFTVRGTGDHLLALLASFFASVSLLNLNMSITLLANQLGMIFMIISLTLFIEVLKHPDKRIYKFSTAIIFLFTLLVHSYSGLLLFTIITVFTVMTVLSEKRKTALSIYLWVIAFVGALTIIVFVLAPRNTFFVMKIISYFNTVFSIDQLTILHFISRWAPEYNVFQLLTIFGIILIANSNRSLEQLMLSWILIISFLFSITVTTDYFGIRLMLTYPTYIVSAISIRHLISSVGRPVGDSNRLFNSRFTLLLLVLFLLDGALTYSKILLI